MHAPKVLIVNDDPASMDALLRVLGADTPACAYQLLTATSSAEALRMVLAHQFAVVLLALSQSGMDGIATAEAIHGHPRAHALPIIFITARDGDELHRLAAYQHGAADYLFTPIIPQILRTKVAIFVELCRTNQQLQAKSEQLARLNEDLHTQRLGDLERINRELEQEVAERKQAEQRARELAVRDPLTALANRRSLLQQLEHAVVYAERNDTKFALLFLDLDKFKNINDTLGHEVGDELLRQVAARLCAAVRVSDVVARLGGDEFVILLEGSNAAADAARVARKIEAAHVRAFHINGHRVKTSASIGIALYPQDGKQAQTLIKNADTAMYHAKQHGGNIKFFHPELNARELERKRWSAELETALAERQFVLSFQPVRTLAGARLCGVDAQLQWQHPRLGLIGAPSFLPGVSDRLLLDQLDDWLINAACSQAALWQDAALPGPPARIAIKLCTAQLHPALTPHILAQLRQCQLAHHWLELNIPECLLLDSRELVEPVLRQLHGAGVRLALDDFGSAGCALAELKRLPFDALKIAPCFVQAIGHDGSHDMLAAIIHIARALGLTVQAKGVASSAQLAALRTLGCDQYLGELSGKALDAAAMFALLQEAAHQHARMPARTRGASEAPTDGAGAF